MKLVRDCIPDIIEDSGKSCKWRWVSDHKEHIHFLKLKILEETSEFMGLFYKNLIENKSVRESFNIAQLQMSQNYDPYYWGAFVLID